MSELSNRLLNSNKDDKFYQKYLDIKKLRPLHTQVKIHYSEYSAKNIDKLQATNIEDENCQLNKYESATHLLALEIKERGKLKEIILNEF